VNLQKQVSLKRRVENRRNDMQSNQNKVVEQVTEQKTKQAYHLNTKLIHGGIDGDPHTGAVSVPIYQTSTYRFTDLHTNSGYDYSRAKNPTRDALEALIAELEGGHSGYAFASGMAAITAVLMLLKSGDKLLISDNVYGGTFRLLNQVLVHLGVNFETVDTSDVEALKGKITEEVKAVFIETPTNPLMDVTDIQAVAQLTKQANVLLMVDNTFMTPYLQNPLALGADIVVHSATKYLGGHSDLIAGLAVTSNQSLSDRLYLIQKSTGGILNPFDAWLLIRGIKTLSVRLARHQENASVLANYLLDHPAIDHVYYPGFKSHPGHAVQSKQARGYGAMIAFVVKPTYDLNAFAKSLQVITFGESLGGVESLMTHPATMTHGAIPEEVREKVGIVENLLRFSVGIEDVKDLIDDLEHAFERAQIGQ